MFSHCQRVSCGVAEISVLLWCDTVSLGDCLTTFKTVLLLLSLAVQPFFFFFYWLYNPGWVSVGSTILFHSCLSSTFALQPIIFTLFRSSSTWSIHLNLGLPAGLVLYGVHSVIFLVVLVFSILITWAANLSLCDYINFIISSCFILCLNSSFILILRVLSGFCVGP